MEQVATYRRVQGPGNRRGQWKHSRPRLRLIEGPQFPPDNMHVLRGLNAERHAAAGNSVDHNGDPIPNNDLLANSSSQN